MHPHSERIPPFCIIGSVKMYIFYRFIDIYRFSVSSPAQWGGVFYILTNTLSISELSLCSQGRLCGARTQLAVTPQALQAPAPRGGKGLGRAPAPRQRVPALPQLCHPQGPLAAPGHRCRLARHFQHPVLLLQQQSRDFRQGSGSRRCYFQKKPTTTTLKHLLQAQLPRPAREPSVLAGAAGAPRWSLQDQSPLELPSTILSKEAE